MAMLNDQMVIAIIIYQTGPSIFPKRIVIVFWPSSMATLSKEWQWTTCPELCSIWVKFEVQGMPCRAMVIIKIVGSVVFFKIHNRNFRSRLEKPFYIPHRLAFVKFHIRCWWTLGEMDPDCASHFEYRLWADAGNYSSLPRNYCEFCASQQELNNPSSNEGNIPFSSICNWILYIYI